MPETRKCSSCGADLPGDAPSALCARCSPPGGEGAFALVDDVSPTKTMVLSFPGAALPIEKAGNMIGHYRLIHVLGEGGMGTVWKAEQEKPVRRLVALKIIKLGMDIKEVIARFEAERQALALMDHPNIAKVLDAGATDSGRPYFVMELVEGERITNYCDKNNLSTRQRLDLFVQICHAIQHAHQKGIIHRDIKPSNIMVAVHDGVPVPKVIDFGIAKATEQRLTDKSLFTALGAFLGTPAYVSPEQAGGMDIDTRSDTYSLGVLLYELLTGKTPFDPREFEVAGLEAMLRMIREKEPQAPSTRLKTMVAGELTAMAKCRQTDPPKLVHLVSGDLDSIVMKCLEKDRTQRYETVNGLASDLLRHVNNEPVVARPASQLYRFQKLVRRNKLAFAAASAVVLALLLGVVVSTWQARRAVRSEHVATAALQQAQAAEKTAEAESKKAEQRLAESEAISKFLTEVFRSPDPSRDGRTITVAETLGTAAKKLETELDNQPERRAKLQTTLASTYSALGLYREAVSLQEKVRDYCLATSGPEHPDTLIAMNNLATFYDKAGRPDEALKLREEGLAWCRKVFGPEHPNTIMAMGNLAVSYDEAGHRNDGARWDEGVHWDEALKLREEVLALSRKVLGMEHPETITAMSALAHSYDNVGHPDEALKLREEVLAWCRKMKGPEHPETLMAMNNLAYSYDKVGRRDEDLKIQEEILPLSRKVNGPEHPDTLLAMGNLAACYDKAGRRDEALKLSEESLALSRKVLGPEHPKTLIEMHWLAKFYCSVGRDKEAIALLEETYKFEPMNTQTLVTIATWQTWFGQDADYESTRLHLVQLAEGTNQAGMAEQAAKTYCLRPSTDAAMLTNALNLAQRAVELGKSSGWLPWYQLALGLAEYRNGQYAAAEQTLTVAEKKVVGHYDILGTAQLFRAMSLFRQNRMDEARKLFSQAETEMPPFPADERKPLLDGKPVNHDVLICWLAFKEARSMLNEPAPAKP